MMILLQVSLKFLLALPNFYLIGLELDQDKTKLLASSNDGFLAVFDIRASGDQSSDNSYATANSHNEGSRFTPKLFALSDNQEEEQTSICVMKNGRKVVLSSQEGNISLFSWDWFGDCNDRITCHPTSISTMVKYDEDTVLTG